MDLTRFTHPIDLHAVSITDPFWQRETELVRREVIPYQWDALNDRIPGAEKSWCMHNFRLAGRIMAQSRQQGAQYTPQAYTYRGYNALPMTPRTRMRTSSTASCFRILTSASGLKPSAIP